MMWKDGLWNRFRPGNAPLALPADRTVSGEDAHAAELRAAPAAQLAAAQVGEALERLDERGLQQARRLVEVVLRAPCGLGDDRVDHAQLEAVQRVGLEGRRRLA